MFILIYLPFANYTSLKKTKSTVIKSYKTSVNRRVGFPISENLKFYSDKSNLLDFSLLFPVGADSLSRNTEAVLQTHNKRDREPTFDVYEPPN